MEDRLGVCYNLLSFFPLRQKAACDVSKRTQSSVLKIGKACDRLLESTDTCDSFHKRTTSNRNFIAMITVYNKFFFLR